MGGPTGGLVDERADRPEGGRAGRRAGVKVDGRTGESAARRRSMTDLIRLASLTSEARRRSDRNGWDRTDPPAGQNRCAGGTGWMRWWDRMDPWVGEDGCAGWTGWIRGRDRMNARVEQDNARAGLMGPAAESTGVDSFELFTTACVT